MRNMPRYFRKRSAWYLHFYWFQWAWLWRQKASIKKNLVPQTTTASANYSVIAKTCDRYGISDRAGAAIGSAVLQATNSSVSVIDKNKLRRERTKTRQKIIANDRISQVPALYFDGRKDKSLVLTKKGGKSYRQLIMEEHISLIKEPDSKYLGHITPSSGSAKIVGIIFLCSPKILRYIYVCISKILILNPFNCFTIIKLPGQQNMLHQTNSKLTPRYNTFLL